MMNERIEDSSLNERVAAVIARLDERSRAENERLEQLRALGGSHLREVARELMLDVGPEVGRLLNMLAITGGAKTIVEVGGSVGYSTLWLAEAASHTRGRVISFETEPGKQAEQRENLVAANLASFVELVGDAARGIEKIPGPIDLVLLDHWKELYVREFDALWPKLRKGGLIVADNIHKPVKNAAVIQQYLDHVRAIPDARTSVLAIGSGIALTCRC